MTVKKEPSDFVWNMTIFAFYFVKPDVLIADKSLVTFSKALFLSHRQREDDEIRFL